VRGGIEEGEKRSRCKRSTYRYLQGLIAFGYLEKCFGERHDKQNRLVENEEKNESLNELVFFNYKSTEL